MSSTQAFAVRLAATSLALLGLSGSLAPNVLAGEVIKGHQFASISTTVPVVAGRSESSTRIEIDELLAVPGLQARLNAWGVGLDEFHNLISRMSSLEQQRLANAWHRLDTVLTANENMDASAMYLSLVVRIRDATLFASIISSR